MYFMQIHVTHMHIPLKARSRASTLLLSFFFSRMYKKLFNSIHCIKIKLKYEQYQKYFKSKHNINNLFFTQVVCVDILHLIFNHANKCIKAIRFCMHKLIFIHKQNQLIILIIYGTKTKPRSFGVIKFKQSYTKTKILLIYITIYIYIYI